MSRLLNTNQVAEKLGIHPETVRKMIRTGEIQALKIGGETENRKKWKVSEEYLDNEFIPALQEKSDEAFNNGERPKISAEDIDIKDFLED